MAPKPQRQANPLMDAPVSSSPARVCCATGRLPAVYLPRWLIPKCLTYTHQPIRPRVSLWLNPGAVATANDSEFMIHEIMWLIY